jgi:parallel beta-helix repeat protein
LKKYLISNNVYFRRTHGFSAYFGVETTTSQYAKNSFILDNIFEDGGTPIVGSLNSDGLTISRNQFIDSGYYTKQYSYFIDLEPNAANCRMDNIIISDNIMNTTAPGRSNRNAIIAQAAGVDKVRNLTIQNNQISGMYLPDNAANLSTGIVIFNGEGVHIKNNTISGALQVGVKIANSSQIHVIGNTLIHVGSRNGGTMAMLFQGINDSIIKDNIFPKRNNYPSGLNEFIDRNHNDSAEIVEQEFGQPVNVSTTGGVTTLKVSRLDEAVGFFDFWVNRRVYLSGGGSGVKEGYYTIDISQSRGLYGNADHGCGKRNGCRRRNPV